MSDKIELLRFLANIWGRENSFVYLSTKPEPELWRDEKPQPWPKNAEFIAEFILAQNALGKEVYFAPARFIDNPSARQKEYAKDSRVLAVDIDGYKDGQTLPDKALAALQGAGLPEPTYRLQSSHEGAEHWYWILDKAYPPAEVEEAQRRLAYFLEADKACWGIQTVFRPPYTNNHKEQHKRGEISPLVTIKHFNSTVYSPDKFGSLPAIKEAMRDILELGAIPPIDEVLAKYPWDQKNLAILKNPSPDDRSNSMVHLAYFCAEIGMTDEAIFSVLLDCDDRWKKFIGRQDRERRLVEILNKVRTKYPAAVHVVEQSTEEIRTVYGIHDFLQTEYTFDWILDGLIARNTINALSSRPGVGKSRLSLQLVRDLATGKDFLGYQNCAGPLRTLFLSLEMGGPVLKYFITELVADSTDFDPLAANGNFRIAPVGEPINLLDPNAVAFFDLLLEEHKPEFVVIDAMSSLAYEDLNEKVSKTVFKYLKACLNKYDITFLLIHHNKKADTLTKDRPPTIDDFYGNTFGTTDLAAILALWKPPQKKYLEFHALKTRIGASPKPLILNGDNFTFRTEIEQESVNDTDGEAPPTFAFGFGSMD